MNTSPPVPEELLLDYASGSCSPAMGLLMATHVSMSEKSRKLCGVLDDVGGAFLDTLHGETMERVTAQSVLELADSGGQSDGRTNSAARPTTSVEGNSSPIMAANFGDEAPPLPLQAYASEFGTDDAWQRLGWSAAAVRLSASNHEERAHLLWAKPGAYIATHRHIGREVVLVLKGAFWDEGVRFGPGDIAIGEDGSIHTPKIDGEAECVCLAVTEAPVHFTGSLGWLLNRYCRF
ncbi:MAG: ChrR family anti-sigma-E factor [Geminicoccaceae bacterium]